MNIGLGRAIATKTLDKGGADPLDVYEKEIDRNLTGPSKMMRLGAVETEKNVLNAQGETVRLNGAERLA